MADTPYADKVMTVGTDPEGSMIIWHLNGWQHLAAHLSEPPITSYAGGETGGSSTYLPAPPTEYPRLYAAICVSIHDPALPGVLANGIWMGPYRDGHTEAEYDAHAHETDGDIGYAQVYLNLYGHLTGPV